MTYFIFDHQVRVGMCWYGIILWIRTSRLLYRFEMQGVRSVPYLPVVILIGQYKRDVTLLTGAVIGDNCANLLRLDELDRKRRIVFWTGNKRCKSNEKIRLIRFRIHKRDNTTVPTSKIIRLILKLYCSLFIKNKTIIMYLCVNESIISFAFVLYGSGMRNLVFVRSGTTKADLFFAC